MKYEWLVSGVYNEHETVQGNCIAASVSEAEKVALECGFHRVTDVQLRRGAKIYDDAEESRMI